MNQRFRRPTRSIAVILTLCAFVAASFAADRAAIQERADRFLELLNAGYQALTRVQAEAQWDAATDVTPVHDAASEVAGKAYAAFNGSSAVINDTQELLLHRAELNDLTVRELERALINAAEGPMTNPQLTANRIAAETAQ